MRKITKNIVTSFLSKTPARDSNSSTDGQSLFLFGNKIAEHRADGLYITDAGRKTKTTKERLNGILNAVKVAQIYQKDFNWYFRGQEWSGDWIRVEKISPNIRQSA